MKTVFKPNPSCGNLNRFLLSVAFFFLFSGSAFAGDLKLAWNASTSTDVGGYTLYYGTSSKNYTSKVDIVGKTTTAYTMTGLTNGSTYFFALKAYNTAKSIESSFSNEASATVPVPTASTLTVDFSPSKTSGTAPLVVTFTPSTNQTVSYNWNFGDSSSTSNTSTAQTASHTYNAAGTYTVTLTVTGTGGATAKTTKQISVAASTTTSGGGTPPSDPVPSPTTTTATVKGLVAAYSFDDFGGAMTADASGNGNHGIIKEAARTASGYFGNALKFDGVNDWVAVSDSASLDLSSGLTIEAMVNPATVMSSWRTVVMKEQSGDEVYSLLANNASNKPVMGQWINGGVKTLYGVSSLAPNTWWHLAATYDGQYQRMYVNGVKVSERAQTGLIQTSNGVMRIGGNSIWGEYFQGVIDEVRIYNRALSSTEVGTDYKTAVSASSPAKLIVGNNTLEPNTGTPKSGTALAFKATPPKTGVVSAIQVFVDGSSTATELVAGIYDDIGGHPGNLVVQGTKASPKAGATNTVPIVTTTLQAGKAYWIGILGSKGQVNYRYRTNTIVPIETCKTTGLTTLPSKWTPGSVAPTNGPMSAYVTGY